MPMTQQPILIDTRSRDEEGMLVFWDGKLVALLICLADECHGELRGQWFPEVLLGALSGRRPGLFESKTAALAWVRQCLSDEAPAPTGAWTRVSAKVGAVALSLLPAISSLNPVAALL